MVKEVSRLDEKKVDRSLSVASTAEQAGRDGDSLSLLDLLLLLTQRKRTIAVITIACMIVGITISYLMPIIYTATVTLLPPQQSSSMSTVLSSQLGGNMGGMAALAAGGLGLKNPNEIYVAMLKSRTVESAMVQRYKLMDEYHALRPSDARTALEHVTTIDGDTKDGLIHISIDDRDPQRAAELANGYVDQFRNLSAHLAITEAAQRRMFFEQQMEQAKNNLAKAEEAMKETEQATGMIQLDSQERALIANAAQLRGEIAAKEVQIQVMRTYATSQNVDLEQAQQELAGLRAQLAKLGGSETSSNNLIMPKGQVTQAGLEYARKFRDVNYYETIFEVIAKQWEAAKLDEAKEGALIQVVDPAIVPDRRSSPRRKLIAIISTVVGLFFGVFAALLRGAWDMMMEDSERRRKLTELRRGWLFWRAKEPAGEKVL